MIWPYTGGVWRCEKLAAKVLHMVHMIIRMMMVDGQCSTYNMAMMVRT